MSPTRPGRPCSKPGCPIIVHGASYCAEHEAIRRHTDPEQAAFYRTSYWTRLSKLVRRMRPICEECKSMPSKVTDHVDGNYRNCAPENLRALCRDCNATKTARQHRAKHAGGV